MTVPDPTAPTAEDVIDAALESALDRAYEASIYRWPQQQDIIVGAITGLATYLVLSALAGAS